MLIASSSVLTALGDGKATFEGLLAGRHAAAPLRLPLLPDAVGYPIGGGDPTSPARSTGLLAQVVASAIDEAGLSAGGVAGARITVVVGTGLGETATVEEAIRSESQIEPEILHYEAAVRSVLPAADAVMTISSACAASGCAMAIAEDLLACGETDIAVVAGVDAMSTSMLAMIGMVGDIKPDRVRPFDIDRRGVLLGEGAAAIVLAPADWTGPAVGRVLGAAMTCDAYHETAPSVSGLVRCMRAAYQRAGRSPADTDLIVAHGTGTALNDPSECRALTALLEVSGGTPPITAVKGATGHTSGCAALVNLDVALRCMRAAVVPPVVGLEKVIDEGRELSFVAHDPRAATIRIAQLNAFGFGGTNSVSLVAAA
jgi:3-oxoacyl-[acyl-carrier-protein] synthase II